MWSKTQSLEEPTDDDDVAVDDGRQGVGPVGAPGGADWVRGGGGARRVGVE